MASRDRMNISSGPVLSARPADLRNALQPLLACEMSRLP
jgi:hypothetical protein